MLPDFSKKRIYSTVSISLLSLFVFLITLSVTFDLKEGSLLKAVFDIYYSFLYRYFSITFLPSFWALVPLSLFLMFTAFYNYMNGKIAIYITILSQMAGLTMMCRKSSLIIILGCILFVFGVGFFIYFIKLRKEKNEEQREIELNIEKEADLEAIVEEKEINISEDKLDFIHKNAKDILNKIEIPKYVNSESLLDENVSENDNNEKSEFESNLDDIRIALNMPDISDDGHISFKVPDKVDYKVSNEIQHTNDSDNKVDIDIKESEGIKNPTVETVEGTAAPVLVVQKESDGKVQVSYTSVKPGQTVVLTKDNSVLKSEAEEEAEEDEKNSTETHEDAEEDEVDMISAVSHLSSSHLAKLKHYSFPSESYLPHFEPHVKPEEDLENDINGKRIVETFAQFNIITRLIRIQYGPTFTLYELSLGAGIKLASVNSVSDNIAMALEASSVRLITPIPGKNAIGVEVPNKERDTIGLDELLPKLKKVKMNVPMVLGRTITGESIIIDVSKSPHILIAGTTGSGKSVCINTLICSILYTKKPTEVRLIMIDPKLVELNLYNDIPHLLTPVITDVDRAIKALQFCVEEMLRRANMFSKVNARNISEYNEIIKEKKLINQPLPYIVVIFDEFADFMIQKGKEITEIVKKITALARFTGIHLVMATQRPSSDVTAGIIKTNIPTRIAFSVNDAINSRIILDTTGAEKLLGKGDMLYLGPENKNVVRIQGPYLGREVEQIVSDVKAQGEPDYIDESYFEDPVTSLSTDDKSTASGNSKDKLMQAWKIVAAKGDASASYLQRKMSIGFNSAARLIEELEELGYIGPARGSKPREIYMYPDDY